MTLPALLLAVLSAAPPALPALAELRLSPPDPLPRALIRNTHYWMSNELRHDLFREAVLERGGLLVGVGTDPNYLLAGWARSEAMILLDFDQSIADLHEAYGVLFLMARGPADFLSLWTLPRRREVEARIQAAFPAAPQMRRVRAAFRTAAPLVIARLSAVRKQLRRRGIASWLDDEAQFSHLRQLWESRRVVAIRGDLVGPRTLAAIGRAASEAGLTVRVLYLSNAEQYFGFDERYRANLAALPMDERTSVLRTLGMGAYGLADGQYHYDIQTGPNLKAWLEDGRVRGVAELLRYRTPGKVYGTSHLERGPQAIDERTKATSRAAARR